jgi:AcrR family transcriptional regulator
MGARAEAAAHTRRRIVDAAMSVQATEGAGASWEAIARRADVSIATVYRHFRSLEELVPACMETIWTREQLAPTPEEAQKVFEGLDRPGDRFEQLVRGSCHCYAKAPAWLAAALADRAAFPAMRAASRQQTHAIACLVDAALGGARVGPDVERTLRALVDFPFWQSLVDTGMTDGAATDVVVRMVRDELRRNGLD